MNTDCDLNFFDFFTGYCKPRAGEEKFTCALYGLVYGGSAGLCKRAEGTEGNPCP